MKIALIQIQSSEFLDSNFKKMKIFVQKAKEQGARLVVFPEMAYFTAKREGVGKIISRYSEISEMFQSWAKEFDLGIVPGTMREPVVG
jgi:predicted amidohydrolase